MNRVKSPVYIVTNSDTIQPQFTHSSTSCLPCYTLLCCILRKTSAHHILNTRSLHLHEERQLAVLDIKRDQHK